jgi:hypothetical protein
VSQSVPVRVSRSVLEEAERIQEDASAKLFLVIAIFADVVSTRVKSVPTLTHVLADATQRNATLVRDNIRCWHEKEECHEHTAYLRRSNGIVYAR